ncbi:MAG: protein kinase domain-containing protein [Acidobacteriota bacterium]
MLGRYVVLSELGRGGMSVVYTAYDPQLDRRVALKVVRGEMLSEAHRARLHREAQALARLSHPAVVTVFDVGDLESDTFVAMELVDGMSLRDWLKTPRRWREVVKVIVAAGRGLAAAHAAGIVHRDVKPGNIVISQTGAVKLVDFGLARDLGDRSVESGDLVSGEPSVDTTDSASSSSSSRMSRPLDAITELGHVVGTPAYMPPEQRGRSVDADERSDQFSLCATLYEALYGQRPFAVSKKQLVDRDEALTVAERPGADTRTLAAPPPKDTDVPAWLQKVVHRGLAVEPNARYPSVEALLDELDRDPARTRARIAAGAGALLGVAALAIAASWKLMPARTQVELPNCDDGSARLAAIWNAERRAALARAPAAQQTPWGAGAVDAFAAQVDRYADAWKAMHLETCRATRIERSQSEEAMDLRMACLDRRLAGLGELVTLMADADQDALRKAGEVVGNLPPVADCADVRALRQVVRRPTDPAIAAKLAAVDGDLAKLSAQYALGNSNKTVALADRVIAEARATSYAPPLAHALYWRGRALADRGSGGDAEAMFDETFSTALGAGEDAMAADAAARLAQEALWAAKLGEFDRWLRIARSLAARAGATGVTAFADQLGCMVNHYYGKARTRLACLRELAARREAAGGPSEWLVTMLGIAASEAGEPAESIHWLERGVELARDEYGVDHPRTLEMRGYLCRGLYELGDYARSAAECKDALGKLQKLAPDDHEMIAKLQGYLADTEAELHHADAARQLAEAAAAAGDDDTKLSARTLLSELAGKHGDVTAAIAEHRAALAETIKAFAQYNPHHANIIAERHELGVALLEAGQVGEAARELARADAEADANEISPLELAELRFAHAKALLRAQPAERAEARRLAADALEIYTQHAPATDKFQQERGEMQAWLSDLDRAAPR